MTDVREQGLRVLQEMLPQLPVENVEPDGSFGDELLGIGIENVFGRLWSREGLSHRDRSLVTMGILIALRATDEFESHVKIGLQNGLTEDEIAEVIYPRQRLRRLSRGQRGPQGCPRRAGRRLEDAARLLPPHGPVHQPIWREAGGYR